jgi:hypothetical protein
MKIVSYFIIAASLALTSCAHHGKKDCKDGKCDLKSKESCSKDGKCDMKKKKKSDCCE